MALYQYDPVLTHLLQLIMIDRAMQDTAGLQENHYSQETTQKIGPGSYYAQQAIITTQASTFLQGSTLLFTSQMYTKIIYNNN